MVMMRMKSENQLDFFFQIFLIDTYAEMTLCLNEAGWRSLLVVERQSYQLSRFIGLTRTSLYSVCSAPKEPTIQ